VWPPKTVSKWGFTPACLTSFEQRLQFPLDRIAAGLSTNTDKDRPMVNQRISGEIKIFHPLRTQELRRAVGNKRSDDN
jgi:hypothetical protein